MDNVSEIEDTLNEMAQNCYDLLGDIIAVRGLCACGNLGERYGEEIASCYRRRIADYIKQHSSELQVLATQVCKQLHTHV